MIAFLFPGQGSQRIGMGRDLFHTVPEFARYEAEIDEILGYSIRALCLEDKHHQLNQTQHTQPSLYTVNAMYYYREIATGGRPSFCAGHSLGEYNALLAAGAFDFLTGLRLVCARGELMARAKGGAMAAVIGLEPKKLSRILEENGLRTIDIANYNSPSQTVISGPSADVIKASSTLEKAGARACIPLEVSAAFHSRYMADAAQRYSGFLKGCSFRPPKVPVLSNVTGKPYPAGDPNEIIPSMLTAQISNPVRWTEIVSYLSDAGTTDFKALGPGTMLSQLVQQVRSHYVMSSGYAEPDSSPLNERENPSESQLQSGCRSNANVVKLQPQHPNELSYKPSQQTVCTERDGNIRPESLGSRVLMADYSIKYAYFAGAMYKGIASTELVVALCGKELMAYLGTGGLELDEIESCINYIKSKLPSNRPFGMNYLANIERPEYEERLVDLFLKYGIRYVEAAAFMQMTPSLVRYRITGLTRRSDGSVECRHRVLAKVSRPEVATLFMQPPAEAIVRKLVESGAVSRDQAELASRVPMSEEICVEADSGGHTDRGILSVLFPQMIVRRDEIARRHRYLQNIRIGVAGGIGTPQAAAAAFVMGADFVLTGSINQCTVEAGTSDRVKDLLQELNVQDTAYAPAGDMFELGAKVQVVKRGLFFPARANKLYELYQRHNSLDEIDEKTRTQIQDKYFGRSFEDVWRETREYYGGINPRKLRESESNPKQKMALVFKWYFVHSSRLALEGRPDGLMDYQIHCGPALGAFNEWVKGTELESWQNRRVAEIADKIMRDTATLLNHRFAAFTERPRSTSVSQAV